MKNSVDFYIGKVYMNEGETEDFLIIKRNKNFYEKSISKSTNGRYLGAVKYQINYFII